MGAPPPQPPPSQPRFSPDGSWWWTGTEWKPAISPDHLWRWNGYQWVPYQVPTGTGGTARITIGIVAGAIVVVAFVSFIAVIILLTMGNQITNVFSNVTAALGT